jgi:hypothetical protein
MSWSVSAVGKAKAVRAEIARQFASGTASAEPEESVRQAAAGLMDAALAAQGDDIAVRANANGSMSFKDWNSKTNPSNSLSVTIEPIAGFVG